MIKKFDIYSESLNRNVHIHLYLPNQYELKTKRYPVIYMYDGHNLFYDCDATYGKSWGLKDYLDNHNKEYIVVGMECNHEGNQRLNEYCPYQLNNSRFGDIEGKGILYMDWVIEELKPYIDEHYHTLKKREYTMIAGSSMGGLMSLYTIIKYNDYFSKAACLSSSIMLCMNELIKDIEVTKLYKDTKIYLDWGSDESRNKEGLAYVTKRNLDIAHYLQEKGVQVYSNLVINGKHNEATWEKQIPVFMDYLWKK